MEGLDHIYGLTSYFRIQMAHGPHLHPEAFYLVYRLVHSMHTAKVLVCLISGVFEMVPNDGLEAYHVIHMIHTLIDRPITKSFDHMISVCMGHTIH